MIVAVWIEARAFPLAVTGFALELTACDLGCRGAAERAGNFEQHYPTTLFLAVWINLVFEAVCCGADRVTNFIFHILAPATSAGSPTVEVSQLPVAERLIELFAGFARCVIAS